MFTNLTPHAITVRMPDGNEQTFPPSGLIARVATVETPTGSLYGVPVVRRTFGAVQIPEGISESGPLIVSSMVLDAAKNQEHPLSDRLFAPDTGPTAIREGGQVKAVIRLVG